MVSSVQMIINEHPGLEQTRKITIFSEMSLIQSPFFFKFLIAPFMDFNYVRKIGRRMSWIIPTGIVSSVLFWYLGFSIEDLIREGNGFQLSLVMFVICLFIAV